MVSHYMILLWAQYIGGNITTQLLLVKLQFGDTLCHHAIGNLGVTQLTQAKNMTRPQLLTREVLQRC